VDIELIDHHCHQVVTRDLDHHAFANLISESFADAPLGTSHWDKPVGLSIRRWCAPVLDLPKFANPEDYVNRRLELGANEVNRRFLRRSGISRYIIDSGNRPGELCSVEDMAALAGVPSHEVIRMECVAEQVVRDGTDAAGYAAAFEAALEASVTSSVVGLKTVIAYRSTLAIDTSPPSAAEVEAAADGFLRRYERTGRARVVEAALERQILWKGAELARDRGLPMQFHIGLGDPDVTMHACDPSHLTQYFRDVEGWNVPMTLLHCYPFVREAGMIAENFPNIYFDVGFIQNWSGPSYARMMRDALETAPFTKQLFSTDAFGLSELFYLGALRFRDSLSQILGDWIARDEIPMDEAARIVALIGGANARRIYPGFS
jgi:uncharacterized protein